MKKKSSDKTAPPIHFNRFVAIDFETADYGRDSACAVALVVAEKGNIIREFYSFIRPPRNSFQFTWLHGISWSDVADQPDFGELWPEIAPLFVGVDFIAAHNASFDRGVLAACCERCHQSPVLDKYLCTMRLARRLWDIRPTKLSDVCGAFDIPLQHHHAGSDALACAKIVLRAWHSGVPESAFLKPPGTANRLTGTFPF
ncbi:MAG: 3'-5' exonuclease [Chitinispirillaceae bacterium]|nr:3'-5' exonuclease [Chitinispirillaceae bacterium]